LEEEGMKTKRKSGNGARAAWRFLACTAALMALSVAGPSPVWAGTEVWYGIIIYVDLEAKGKIDGKGEDGKDSAHCIVWMFNNSNNGDHTRDGCFLRYPLPDDKDVRAGRHRYYLDGRKSTRAEAAKVGNLVGWTRATTPGIWFEAWSFPKKYAEVWRFPDADADPKQAIWTLSLSPGLSLPSRAAKEHDKMRVAWCIKPPETVDTSTTRDDRIEASLNSGLTIKLATVNGRVTHGYARMCAKFLHYFPINGCDAVVKDGRLTGKIPISVLLYPLEIGHFLLDAQGKPTFQTTVTIELDVTVDKKGVVTGAYTGGVSPSADGKPTSVKQTVLGCVTKPAVIREPRRAMVRIGPETHTFQLLADGSLDPSFRPLMVQFGDSKMSYPITVEKATGSLRDGILKVEMIPPAGKWCRKAVFEGRLIDDEIYGISQQVHDIKQAVGRNAPARSGLDEMERRGGFHGRLQFLDEAYPQAMPLVGTKDEAPKEAPYIWGLLNVVCNFSALHDMAGPVRLTVGDRPVYIEGQTEKYLPKWATATLGMKRAACPASK
jgi:hypothetical protein